MFLITDTFPLQLCCLLFMQQWTQIGFPSFLTQPMLWKHTIVCQRAAPEPLAVTLMSLYKKDMVAVLEGLADNAGISTTYVDRTPAAREKRNKRSNDARKKRQAKDKDDAQGPPNRNSDFKKPKNSKMSYSDKLSLKPSPAN